MKTVTILFLAANPVNTNRLNLDEEIRSIDQALRQSEFRDRFDIRQHWAVRPSDVQSQILRYRPEIVHFSGHGSRTNEIILQDELGRARPVSTPGLRRLFRAFQDVVKCVVLNVCYSEQQARAIAEHVDCVIGMSRSIGDRAAIKFAASFYQALGYGKDIQAAFDLGRAEIDLDNLNEEDVPTLLAERCDPSALVFVQTDDGERERLKATGPLVPPVREIAITESAESDSPVRVRRIVEGRSQDRASRVFDVLLQNTATEHIMLTKYEVSWRYSCGTALALTKGEVLKPVAAYVIEIPIDTTDESWRKRSGVLYPMLILPPQNHDGISLTTLRLQLHYYITNVSESHSGSDWDIIFSVHLVDEMGGCVPLFSKHRWKGSAG